MELTVDTLDRPLCGCFGDRVAAGCQIQPQLDHGHLNFVESIMSRLAIAAGRQ
jgi:hypothetical protein